MTYLTRAQFEKRFGATELEELTEQNDFNAAAGQAQSLIDGYLASSYTLPLSSVPSLVTAWAADITRFLLWDDHAPEEVRKRYDDAISQLGQLARGIIKLPPDALGTPVAGSLSFGGFSAERVFTADTLRDF